MRVLLGSGLCAVLVLASCSGEPDDTGGPGILLVVLGGVGAATEDAFAADPAAVLFERHYAASPDSEASIASILTGHPTRPGRTADSKPPSLTELFSQAGFVTFTRELDDAELSRRGLNELTRSVPEGFFGFVSMRNADTARAEKLLETLQELDRLDEILLVVTSDCGSVDEAEDGIGADLREPIVHVPLIARFPAGQRPETLGARVRSVTRAIDLAPSLLTYAGVEAPESLQGELIFEGRSAGHAFVDSAKGWAFVQDNYKLVVEAEKVALYDFAQDPGARHDIAGEIPRRTRGLVIMAVGLRSRRAGGPREAPDEQGILDEEMLEHLRSLGYVQ